MAKILLVEDDLDLSGEIVEWLTGHQHSVDVVHDGEQGVHRLLYYKYDLAIIDWMLPKATGVEICKRHRDAGGNSPILMLTGRDTISDKESGFDAGADDYLTKPFDLKELSARIRALLRRPATFTGNLLSVKDLTLEPGTHRVTKGGAEIRLLPKEFALLEFLMRHPNEVFSPDSLLDRVWSSDSDSAVDTVYTNIKTLRKKISPDSPSEIIKTVHGLGYKLVSP